MSAASVGLAAVTVSYGDRLGTDWLGSFAWLYSSQPEGARSLLATVAGSMITVAGVTFSMTLLMVSHASAQIGPRVVAGFMRDRGAQVVLGSFIATFLYCLVVLRTVTSGAQQGGGDVETFVPQLAVLVAVGLAVLCVAVLIYFIHHVPMRINVASVTNRIGKTALEQLEAVFPDIIGVPADDNGHEADVVPATPRPVTVSGDDQDSLVCLDGVGGYLRVVDHEGLMELAGELDCVLETLVVPGEFCVRGTALIRLPEAIADENVEQKLQALFSWGGDRTQDQDILFLIDQLAEISGKALSPGVNDQFTAFGCIDQMERLLREASRRSEPAAQRYDGDGMLRVIARTVTHGDIANRFLDPIRQFSLGDFITTKHLAAMLGRVIGFCDKGSALYIVLLHHYRGIRDDAKSAFAVDWQRKELARHCQAIERDNSLE
jgi:uncharacterized membrane protein